jgi:hypothetical protein
MNYDKAVYILKLGNDVSIENIKKQYRLLALKYHPDKNLDKDTNNLFIEINESYEFLLAHNKIHINSTENSYQFIFNDFLKSLFGSNVQADLLFSFIHHLTTNYTEKFMDDISKEIVDKMDKDSVIFLYNLLVKYREILNISDNIVNEIKRKIEGKIKEDQIVVLNPSIKDLINDNIYVLKLNNEKFFVPLWHHELNYITECNGKPQSLNVFCKPELPREIELNENNDLIIYIRRDIKEILEKKILTYNFGNKVIVINSHELKLVKYQHFVKTGCGISRINTNDFYNNNEKSDIIFIIELF